MKIMDFIVTVVLGFKNQIFQACSFLPVILCVNHVIIEC